MRLVFDYNNLQNLKKYVHHEKEHILNITLLNPLHKTSSELNSNAYHIY
jgi:hypothetical protein